MERCEKTLQLFTSPLCLSNASLHLSTVPLHLSNASLHFSTAPLRLSTTLSTFQNPREGSRPSLAPSPSWMCPQLHPPKPCSTSKTPQQPGEGSHPSSTPSPCPQLQPPQGAVTQGAISLSFPHEIKEQKGQTRRVSSPGARGDEPPHTTSPGQANPTSPCALLIFFLGWGSAFSAWPRDFLGV